MKPRTPKPEPSRAPPNAAGDRGDARARRRALEGLLRRGSAHTQQALVELLGAQGFAATQSTISRDLKRLGAQRGVGLDGEPEYSLVSPPTRFPAEMVVDIRANEAMVVVRTTTGRAPAVGLEIDRLAHADVLGTLAGDDAVLVIPASTTRVPELVRWLRGLAQRD